MDGGVVIASLGMATGSSFAGAFGAGVVAFIGLGLLDRSVGGAAIASDIVAVPEIGIAGLFVVLFERFTSVAAGGIETPCEGGAASGSVVIGAAFCCANAGTEAMRKIPKANAPILRFLIGLSIILIFFTDHAPR